MEQQTHLDSPEVLKNIINEKEKKIISQSKEIVQLNEMIDFLRKSHYAPKSEVVPSEQLGLFNEIEDIASDEIEEETETITYTRRKNKRPTKIVIPDSIPREDVILDLPEDEKICENGAPLKEMSRDISEKIEIVPAKAKIIRQIRINYACKCCDSPVKAANLPKTILPGTKATPSLLSYIATSKFCDSLPLYRLEGIFQRLNITLPRQNMARWLIQSAEIILPLINILHDSIFEQNYVQLDETHVQVLKEDGKKATSKSYIWVAYAPLGDPIVLYHYSPSRGAKTPKKLLEDFKGAVQTDGYSGYSWIDKEKDMVHLGCSDHSRREFKKAYSSASGKNIGKKGLIFWKKLYKIEDKIDHLSHQKRYEIRLKESKPILDEMKAWIDGLLPNITPKSLGGKAIHYTYNQWDKLIKYLDDGSFEMSNIWVENKIRPFVIGRKNWPFSASVAGAETSCLFYSLIETAKANNIDPFKYLSIIMELIPYAETLEDFECLLPLHDQFLKNSNCFPSAPALLRALLSPAEEHQVPETQRVH